MAETGTLHDAFIDELRDIGEIGATVGGGPSAK